MLKVTLAEEGIESLYGARDENLKRIEKAFEVTLTARGNRATIDGDAERAAVVRHLLLQLSALAEAGYALRPDDIATSIRVLRESPEASLVDFFSTDGLMGTVRRLVTPRSLKQQLRAFCADHDESIVRQPGGPRTELGWRLICCQPWCPNNTAKQNKF